tara:strand:+ start:17844 stop:18182 length:339 start_codon:yes stop_codon:yes gene_type:complete
MEGYPKIRDILEKRDEIMNKETRDEYIQVPGDNDDDADDVSTRSFKLYHRRAEAERYNLGKGMYELTEAVKLYLDKERTRKVSWAIGKCFVGFIGISGLIVLNDFIVINYFL